MRNKANTQKPGAFQIDGGLCDIRQANRNILFIAKHISKGK